MCGTTDSSFQSSNTLNNTGVWSLIQLVSLYTVLNGLSCLATTSNRQARPIRKFSIRPITFESNHIGQFEFESNLEASQVPNSIALYVAESLLYVSVVFLILS